MFYRCKISLETGILALKYLFFLNNAVFQRENDDPRRILRIHLIQDAGPVPLHRPLAQ